MHLWLKTLTQSDARQMAAEFCEQDIAAPNLAGPVLGDRIEKEFMSYLDSHDYDRHGDNPTSADIGAIHTDVKSLQVRGKRVGSAKIHGYGQSGPPDYSMLVFRYTYDGQDISFEDVLWIDNKDVEWVRAHHYLFSLPDDALEKFKVE